MKKCMKVLIVLLCTAALLSGCSTPFAWDESQGPVLAVDRNSGEVRLTGVVQKTQAPRMKDWGAKKQALLGARDGDYHDYFVFLMDARVSDIYRALLELGADTGKAADGGMRGTPLEILIQWTVDGHAYSLPYQNFFQQKVQEGAEQLVTPWKPRFVFHGSGAESGASSGCIACPLYCPGGIIGSLTTSVPTLRADWTKLPRPGTRITVVIRILRSMGSP